MKKQHVKLLAEDKIFLEEILSKSVQKLRVQKRAKALQLLDAGQTYKQVQKDLKISYPTILKWAKHYNSNRLDFLQDKPRSGRPLEISGKDRAKITALACSKAPKGYAKWSLRLLSERIVALEILDKISHTEVGRILKKTNFNHIEKNNGVFEL